MHCVEELAQVRARFTRIDHILYSEGLRREERRGKRAQIGFDFLEALLRIRRGLDLAPEGRYRAAFHRKRAPFGARPGDFQVEPFAVRRRHAGHAVALADDHREHRHRGLRSGVQAAHAFAQRGLLLGLQPDHEARDIHQEHERDMEGIAQLDEMCLLPRRPGIHRSAVDHRVVGDEADHLAVHPAKRDDDRTREGRLDLESRPLVGDHFEKLPHVVGLPAVARHDGEEILVAPVGRVAGFDDRGQLPDVLRHEAEIPADHREAFLLVLRGVVYGPGGLHRDLRAAQFFFGVLLAERPFDHRRTRREDLGASLHHYRARILLCDDESEWHEWNHRQRRPRDD